MGRGGGRSGDLTASDRILEQSRSYTDKLGKKNYFVIVDLINQILRRKLFMIFVTDDKAGFIQGRLLQKV